MIPRRRWKEKFRVPGYLTLDAKVNVHIADSRPPKLEDDFTEHLVPRERKKEFFSSCHCSRSTLQPGCGNPLRPWNCSSLCRRERESMLYYLATTEWAAPPLGGKVYQSQGQAKLLKGRCSVTTSPARLKVSSGSHSQPGWLNLTPVYIQLL